MTLSSSAVHPRQVPGVRTGGASGGARAILARVISAFGERRPRIHDDVWVADSAIVVGDVTIGAEASIWFGAVVRGDVERIHIGARTNVQDHATIHVTTDRFATQVGDGVTIGHAAVLHGCEVGDHCLVGIGAIVLDGACIAPESLIGAGALITPGASVPRRSLVLGSPGSVIRSLSDEEVARLHASADAYVAHARRYRALGLG